MLRGPTPKDIRRFDFAKFAVLLALSVLLAALLLWQGALLAPPGIVIPALW